MGGLHYNQTHTDGIHQPFNWVWADSTERTAETVVTADINKIGLQEDTGIVYRLEDTVPTWTPFAGVTALNDLTDVDAATPTNGDILVYNSVSGNWENTPASTLSNHIIEDAVTAAITPAVALYHRTTGTSAQGFGTGLDVYAENPAGSDEIMGSLNFLFSDTAPYNYKEARLNLTDGNGVYQIPVLRIGGIYTNPITNPNKIGVGSIDLQTYRSANTDTTIGDYSCILGGFNNSVYAGRSGIVAADNSLITANSDVNIVVGGNNHYIDSTDNVNGIFGGRRNTITGYRQNFILGSYRATIDGNGRYSSILSGYRNHIYQSNYAGIVLGRQNTISESDYSFISSGRDNYIYQSHRSVIVGGYLGLISGIDYGFIGGGNYNRIDGGAGSQNFIGMGLNNRIYASYYGLIGDGYGNIISAPDSYNVIVNGENNQIQGIVKGDRCLIGTGSSNFIQETGYGSILNGKSNHVGSGSTSAYGLILTGTSNLVVSSMGTIITGKGAYVNNYAQVASAGGTTDGQGTIQMVANRTVTHSGTGAYELYLDNTAERINIAAGSVWTFETLIVGSDATLAKRQSYIINGAISNVGGTTTILASNKTVVYEDDANFDANVNTASGYLIVEVSDSGSSGTTMKWTATIRTAEITP